MTRRKRLTMWSAVNATGMALGFLSFIETLNLVSFGLDFSLHWSEEAIAQLEEPERLLRVGSAIGLPLAGAILAACQAVYLRRLLARPWLWILCGPAGFVIPMLVIWPLAGIWGDIPGPVEPFTIVVGGLLGVGILQWLLLRRQGIDARRWLTLWIIGMPLGVIAFVVVVGAAMQLVGPPAWPLEIALYGIFIGGTAAAISGNHLLDRLAAAARD